MILYFYYALDYKEKNKKCDMIKIGMKHTSKIFRIRLVQYRTFDSQSIFYFANLTFNLFISLEFQTFYVAHIYARAK